MENGYLMLARKTFDHWLWSEGRSLSKFEAWLDLLQLAAYAPYKRIIKGHVVELGRGELIASVRYLATRWGWKKDKVASYLRLLASDAMIRRTTRHGQTVISLVNFETYNRPPDAPPDTKSDRDQTEARQTADKGEEEKEEKEGGQPCPPPSSDRFSDRMPTETARRFEEFTAWMNSLHPSWKQRPHLTKAEMDALYANRNYLLDLTDRDRALLALYLPAKIDPEWGRFWQPDTRGKFIETISDVLESADRWKRECEKRVIKLNLP